MNGVPMALWDWALEVHGWAGVDAALIALQDDHGQCVSYLLWAAWTASAGRPLDAASLDRGADLTRRWEGEVTSPLRAARRGLKPAWPGVADAAREALRGRVKADELDAERCLLEALEALSPIGAPTGAPAGANVAQALVAASAAWNAPNGVEAPKAALDHLARIFEAQDV
jgi:uncharacterized protein (TIGR02444 family)